MEATANAPVKSSTWLLVVPRMSHFLVVMSSYLSLPPQSFCSGLDEGDSVAVPLDGGHGNPIGQVPGVVAGGGGDDPPLGGSVGEDEPLLSGSVLLSIPPTPVVLQQA